MLRTVAVFGIFGSFALIAASAIGVVGSTGCSSSSNSSSSGGGGGSSGGGSGEQVDCPSSGAECTGPAADAAAMVSFSSQIQPILQGSCGVGGPTCHGQSGSGSAQNLYLAEPKANADGLGDPTTILKGIVGVASLEVPTMDIISAGDPTNSYLMHKIDGDFASIMSECAPISNPFPNAITVPCGVQMPQSSPPLLTSEATLIWDWIAQGAQNN
jgi:hypothetical protein